MVCGPKIHLREGSLLPRGERSLLPRGSTAQSSEHDDEIGFLDRG